MTQDLSDESLHHVRILIDSVLRSHRDLALTSQLANLLRDRIKLFFGFFLRHDSSRKINEGDKPELIPGTPFGQIPGVQAGSGSDPIPCLPQHYGPRRLEQPTALGRSGPSVTH